MSIPLGVGDVLAVQTPGLPGELIRLGDDLRGTPTPANHVVIVHHVDDRKRWWGIQGQPGGVGWTDLHEYTMGSLSKFTRSNALQPRTDQQRNALAATAVKLLGTQYDWVGGIAVDGLDDVHMKDLAAMVEHYWGWSDPDNPEVAPGHVVCSSLAAWVYRSLGVAAPRRVNTEAVQPADWWLFNDKEQWK